MNTNGIPQNATKFTFRYNNWEDYQQAEGTYKRFIQWCGSYEIEIKYIGKSANKRCHWLQITVDKFTAAFILANMKYLELYKAA